jgi:hypothetical protein
VAKKKKKNKNKKKKKNKRKKKKRKAFIRGEEEECHSFLSQPQ